MQASTRALGEVLLLDRAVLDLLAGDQRRCDRGARHRDEQGNERDGHGSGGSDFVDEVFHALSFVRADAQSNAGTRPPGMRVAAIRAARAIERWIAARAARRAPTVTSWDIFRERLFASLRKMPICSGFLQGRQDLNPQP